MGWNSVALRSIEMNEWFENDYFEKQCIFLKGEISYHSMAKQTMRQGGGKQTNISFDPLGKTLNQ